MNLTRLFYILFKLELATLAVIIFGTVICISVLFITICLVHWSGILRKYSSRHINSNFLNSHLWTPSQRQISSHPIPLTNNSEAENQINVVEKSPYMSRFQSLPSLPSPKVSLTQANFDVDKSFQGFESTNNYDKFLQLGSMIMDRPIGIGLQPYDNMGPTLMKFSMCELHWIRQK